MSRATGRHTRPKKLNAKQNVQIFREDQVESLIDYDSQRAQIETGVEKAEEAVSLRPLVTLFPLALAGFGRICPLLVAESPSLGTKSLTLPPGIPSSTSHQSIRSSKS